MLILGSIESEREITGKSILIPFYGLVQCSGGDPVQFRQISIEHDLLATNPIDPAFDSLEGSIHSTPLSRSDV